MTFSRRGVLTALPLAALVTLVGCTSDGTPQPASTVVTPASAGQVAQLVGALRDTATATWPTVTDSETGLRFAFPVQDTPVTSTLVNATQRLYQYDVPNPGKLNAGLSVDLRKTTNAASARGALDIYPEELAKSFEAAGSGTKSRVVSRRQFTYRGLRAVDARLTFIPKVTSGSRAPVLWLLRVVADGAELVIVQTILIPPDDNASYLPQLQTIQNRMAGSLVFR